jgi:hypothetical protein
MESSCDLCLFINDKYVHILQKRKKNALIDVDGLLLEEVLAFSF